MPFPNAILNVKELGGKKFILDLSSYFDSFTELVNLLELSIYYNCSLVSLLQNTPQSCFAQTKPCFTLRNIFDYYLVARWNVYTHNFVGFLVQ